MNENGIEKDVLYSEEKKKRWSILCITYLFGIFGVHKFMEGDTKNGMLYLCTLGLFFFGWIYDLLTAIFDVVEVYINSKPSIKNFEINNYKTMKKSVSKFLTIIIGCTVIFNIVNSFRTSNSQIRNGEGEVSSVSSITRDIKETATTMYSNAYKFYTDNNYSQAIRLCNELINNYSSNYEVYNDALNLKRIMLGKVVTISASELFKVYDENIVKADEYYTGKYLKVTGEIASIYYSDYSGYWITLQANGIFSSISCYFIDQPETKKLINYNEGSYIEVYGKCSGMNGLFDTLSMDNCILIEE